MGSDEPVYLLSLDGGGIRGMSELVILHEIMTRLQKTAGLKDLPKPRDYFHLIGGTSTGGLIAIMLGRMGMTTKEAIDCYNLFAEKVFRSSNRRWRRTFGQKALERVIQDLVAERGLASSSLMIHDDITEYAENEETDRKGLAFVVSVAGEMMQDAYLFRTYRGTTNHAHNVEIWEAARATTAAPMFFRPISIKVEGSWNYYRDGALAHNNPAKLVLEEAESQFGSGRKLGFILSLGTGLKTTDAAFADAERINQRALQTQQQPRKLSASFFSRDFRPVVEHVTSSVSDTEPTHHELEQRFRLVPNAYFRLNLDKGASDIKLHQYKKMEVLREATERYLRDPEVSATVDQIVGRLHKKEGVEMPLDATYLATSHEAFKHAVIQEVKIKSIASPLFTGRSEILNEFEQRFCERARGSSPRRLLRIWGMGGVGKTQIALQFRDLYGSRFGRVFWVQAATLDSVFESFRVMTEQIFGGTRSRPDIKSVLDWLAFGRGRQEEWLLIFDNNDADSVDISKFIPQGNTGNILFTSRQKDSSPVLDDEQTLAVDVMNETDAVALLLRSSRRQKETLDFSERLYSESVVRELGYLPLAIDQAGSYVSLHECTFGTYLAEFVKRRKYMLSDSSLYPGAFEHNPAVYGTFELSYEALEKRTRESTAKGHAALNALRVLSIFCFYHNENLTGQIIDRAATNSKVDKDVLGDMESAAPLPLLELNNDKSWNSKNYTEGIGLLRSYSLVKKSAFNGEDYSMHILVHCWARDRMRADVFKFQQRAARSILFDSFHLHLRFEEERFLVQLVPHLKALIDRGGSDDPDWYKSTRQESKYARLLSSVGMWKEALWVLEKVVEDRRERIKTGEEGDWLIIAGLWDLGKIHRSCGNLPDAENFLAEASNLLDTCTDRKWVNKAFLSINIDLSEVFIQRGLLGTAEKMLTWILEHEQERADKSPFFRRGTAALALAMQVAGKLKEAEALESRVLDLCIENPKVGPGDRSMMSAISNIATLRSAKGEHQSADEMWRHVLEVDQKFRGKEHPITLQSKRNVAIGCVKLDRLDEAESLLREVLEASERVLWRTHLDTLVTMDCLAGLLYQKGEQTEALELQEECLAGRIRGLGDDHQLTEKTKRDLERMKHSENMVMVEQVQWQGEAAPTAGDSNFAMQGINDRYLY